MKLNSKDHVKIEFKFTGNGCKVATWHLYINDRLVGKFMSLEGVKWFLEYF